MINRIILPFTENKILEVNIDEPINQLSGLFYEIQKNLIYFRIGSMSKTKQSVLHMKDHREYIIKHSNIKIILDQNTLKYRAGIEIQLPVRKGQLYKNIKAQVVTDDNNILNMSDFLNLLLLSKNFSTSLEGKLGMLPIKQEDNYLFVLNKYINWGPAAKKDTPVFRFTLDQKVGII